MVRILCHGLSAHSLPAARIEAATRDEEFNRLENRARKCPDSGTALPPRVEWAPPTRAGSAAKQIAAPGRPSQ